jgi:TetR/AcrR family transcriptional repressor of nem operon
VQHLVAFSVKNEALYHAVFHATTSHSDEPWTESRELIMRVLEGGRDADEFDVLDLDVSTDFLLHAYAGPCYHSDDTAHVVDQLQRLFRRVIGASAGT